MKRQGLLFRLFILLTAILYFSSCEVNRNPVGFISGNLHWEQANGPYGGMANDIVQGPDSRLLASSDFGGVYLSGDLGASWVNIGLRGAGIVKVFIASDGVFYAGTQDGLYFSENDGETWHKVNYGPAGMILQIYENTGGTLFVASGGGLFYRPVGGKIWQEIEGPGAESVLAVAEGGPDVLFVAAAAGIFRSDDNGISWERIPIDDQYFRLIIKGKSGNLLAVGLSSTSERVYLSKDDFRTWEQVFETSGPIYNLTLDEQDNYYLAAPAGLYFSNNQGRAWHLLLAETTFGIAPTRQGVLLAAAGDGIFRSADAGLTWQESNHGLSAVTFSALAVAPLTGAVYAGSGQGFYRSTDRGESWQKRSDKNFYGVVAVSAMGFVYAAHYMVTPDSTFLERSADGGATWQDVSPPAMVTALTFNRENRLYAATRNGVYYSPDNGNHWNSAGLQGQELLSLAFNGERLFAGSQSDLFYSDDNGRSWVRLDSLSARQICANSHGHIFLNEDVRIQRSVDGGRTWTVLDLPLNDKYTRIAYLLCAPGGGLMAAVRGEGILVSTDDGDHWQFENEGLPSKYVDMLAMHPHGRIYAGVFKGSIYRTRGFAE
ncbi:MAG: hypothetical protein P8184_17805 [Calditrichia bacterium]